MDGIKDIKMTNIGESRTLVVILNATRDMLLWIYSEYIVLNSIDDWADNEGRLYHKEERR